MGHPGYTRVIGHCGIEICSAMKKRASMFLCLAPHMVPEACQGTLEYPWVWLKTKTYRRKKEWKKIPSTHSPRTTCKQLLVADPNLTQGMDTHSIRAPFLRPLKQFFKSHHKLPGQFYLIGPQNSSSQTIRITTTSKKN